MQPAVASKHEKCVPVFQPMVEQHLGIRIKAAMKAEEISASSVADACEVSVQAVYKWIRTGEVARKHLTVIATLVNRSIGELLGEVVASNASLGPDNPRPYRRVPVVGRAKGGDNGFMEEEQYPVGHGNGYIEFPTKDPNAFGLLVSGTSMFPRYRHGEFALIEPNATYIVGDDVYVALRDGRKLIKTLAWDRADAIQLDSLNSEHKPIVILKEDIEAIYPSTPVHRRHFSPD